MANKNGSTTPKPHKQRASGNISNSTKQLTALDYALRYAKEGIRVIWAPSGRKGPIVDGPKLATRNPATIRRWAKEHPGCNFCLVMGNGFMATDRDKIGSVEEHEDFMARLGLTETRTQVTPGKVIEGEERKRGLHQIFKVRRM